MAKLGTILRKKNFLWRILTQIRSKFKRLAKDRVPDIQDEQDIETLLRKLNLYDGDQLKRAAILLFGKNPQQFYIQSHSRIGRFLSQTDIQSSDIIEGNLINQVDLIMDVLEVSESLYFLRGHAPARNP